MKNSLPYHMYKYSFPTSETVGTLSYSFSHYGMNNHNHILIKNGIFKPNPQHYLKY